MLRQQSGQALAELGLAVHCRKCLLGYNNGRGCRFLDLIEPVTLPNIEGHVVCPWGWGCIVRCRARDFKQSVDDKTEWTTCQVPVFVLCKSAVMNLVQGMRFLHPPRADGRGREADCGAVSVAFIGIVACTGVIVTEIWLEDGRPLPHAESSTATAAKIQ